MSRRRVTITIDEDLVDAASAAVAAGRAPSVSAWVNEALIEHRAHEARLIALSEAVAAYEAEHGEITDEQMAAQARADRDAAAAVRARAGQSQTRRAGSAA